MVIPFARPTLHVLFSPCSSPLSILWEFTVLPPPWRTSTFVSVTLPCNCLFTHLFPPGDSGLSEVGNFVLFHFAVSCCLQRNPEQKGGPPIASMWSATSEFGPSYSYLSYWLLIPVMGRAVTTPKVICKKKMFKWLGEFKRKIVLSVFLRHNEVLALGR